MEGVVLRLTVDKLEYIVVDEVAVGVLEELEGLAVVHGALFLIHLLIGCQCLHLGHVHRKPAERGRGLQ